MATELKNISEPLTSVAKQLYVVPAGKTAIVLHLSTAPLEEAVKLYVFKQKLSGANIVLIPNKLIPVEDIYVPSSDKLILNAGDTLFARILPTVVSPVRAFAWMGFTTYYNPSNVELAHLSLSIAEKNASN
jgi:uncharacterized protein YdaL